MHPVRLSIAAAALALTVAACDRKDEVPPPEDKVTATTVRTNPNVAPTAATAETQNPVMPKQATDAKAMAGEVRAQRNALIDNYLAVQTALANDDLEAAKEAADALSEVADDIEDAHTKSVERFGETVEAAADQLEDAGDLATARAAFKALTVPMEAWNASAKTEGIDTVYCEMSKGRWLQATGKIQNPYHGKEMQTCGEVVDGPGKTL